MSMTATSSLLLNNTIFNIPISRYPIRIPFCTQTETHADGKHEIITTSSVTPIIPRNHIPSLKSSVIFHSIRRI